MNKHKIFHILAAQQSISLYLFTYYLSLLFMKLTSLFMALAMGATAAVQAQTFVSTTPANRNVVLEEFTGIRCVYCPDGHRIAADIMANNPGRAWAVNIHAGSFAPPQAANQSDYRTAVGNVLDSYFPISGYPTGTVNRGGMSNRGQWASQTTTRLAQASPVNVAARCTIDLDTRQLTMTVESYYTGAGVGTANRLNVFLLQNNVEGYQLGASANSAQVLPNGNYNHMHMLRHSLTGNWGTSLSPVTSGSFHSTQYTYTIPASYTNVPAILTDLEVIAFINADTFVTQTATKATMTYLTTVPLRVVAIGAGISTSASGNTFCGGDGSSSISVLNTGANAITSIAGTYTVNGGTAVPFTHTPAAAAATGSTINFDVNNIALPNVGANNVVVTINSLNGSAVTVSPMNITLNAASSVTAAEDSVRFSITFDNYASETTWSFVNESTGATVASGGPYVAADNATTRVFMLPIVDGNCYKMELRDAAGDGICCAYGVGALSVSLGTTTLLSNPSYGAGAISKFNYSRVVGISQAQEAADNIRLYPNPATDNLSIEFNLANAADLNIEITNALGQVVSKVSNGNTAAGFHNLQVSTANLASGTYFVRFLDGNKATAQRFTVIR
jgi:hypothetical protein